MFQMTTRRIDLGKYSSKGVGVLAGRERGAAVRKEENLDAIDASADDVEVFIPDRLYAVNTSFFLGMFERSIVRLGADRFRARYHFVGRDAEATRDEGIRIAALYGTPLVPR